MGLTTIQAMTVGAFVLIAVFFVSAARRHIAARRAIDVYLEEFARLCDDDRVNMAVLENMKQVFEVSCKFCAAWQIFIVMMLYRWIPEFRREVDKRSLVSAKDLTPATARQML